jgi:hypothetical protein
MRPASFVRRVKLEVKAAWVSFQFCSSSLQVVAYSLFLFSAILCYGLILLMEQLCYIFEFQIRIGLKMKNIFLKFRMTKLSSLTSGRIIIKWIFFCFSNKTIRQWYEYHTPCVQTVSFIVRSDKVWITAEQYKAQRSLFSILGEGEDYTRCLS